ncbi:MAG TPA: hypothetical protein DCE42_05505 [Myxococcales bacterium]|nr:hypothetical protein [Myxococcales bacterium]|tara:strand:+ start:4563 stop:5108 length:546 start_codon:yes stop_codon:yes gene_type:complete
MKLYLTKNAMLGLLTICLSIGIVGCKQTQVKQNKITKRPQPIKKLACIKGRVINDKDKGFGGVQVTTLPHTTYAVTDQFGNFEICHRKVLIDKDTGETQKEPLEHTIYAIRLKRSGFHHPNISIEYKGDPISIKRSIPLYAKEIALPEVVDSSSTKCNNPPCSTEEKREGGLIPPAPRGGN